MGTIAGDDACIVIARNAREAAAEIIGEAGRQFDPTVVEAFRERQARLRRVHYELAKD